MERGAEMKCRRDGEVRMGSLKDSREKKNCKSDIGP